MSDIKPAPRAELLALVAAMRDDLDPEAVGELIADQHIVTKVSFERIAVETVGMAARHEDLRDLRRRLNDVANYR